MELNYIVVFIMLLILVTYLLCYQYKENFEFTKRRFNAMEGLNSGISPPWTVPSEVKNKVEYYCKKIIEEVNKKTGKKYVFSKFDYLKEEQSSAGERYLVELFAHDISKNNHNSETKRLIINFTALPGNKLQINTITISNSAKFTFNQKMGDELHFNPTIDPSQDKPLILTDENLMKNENINGVYNTELQFSKHEGCIGEKRIPSLYRNWILPLGTEEQHWERMKGKCMNVPFNPNPVMSSIDKNNYSWLFNMTRGNIGFPHGSSRSG